MIKLEIKSIRIESTNKNHRPVLRKKTLREEYNELITLYISQGEGTREQLVERLMDQAVKSMTLVPDGKYTRSREELAWRFKEQYKGEPMTGRLHVLIIIETYKDADNFKIICDALQDSGVIKNDREVVYYAVAKNIGKRGSEEKIIVQIYQENEQKELGFDIPLSDKISILDRQAEEKT